MNRRHPRRRATPPTLVISTTSLELGRRIGPTAWLTLQYLALSSRRTDNSWAAPVGVRDIAAGIGVTKDTAARAISALAAAGVVTRHLLDTPGGRRRSGYLLHLPEPIRLVQRDHPDAEGAGPAQSQKEECSASAVRTVGCYPDLDPPGNEGYPLSQPKGPLFTGSPTRSGDHQRALFDRGARDEAATTSGSRERS